MLRPLTRCSCLQNDLWLPASQPRDASLLHLFSLRTHLADLEELVLTGIDLSNVSLQLVKESISNIKTVSLQKNFFDKMSEVELLREGEFDSKS